MSRASTAPAWMLALAILAVSWGAILVRFCQAPALVIAFYRLAFATILVLPLSWLPLGQAPAVRSRSWIGLAVCAGVLLALHFGTWITSLSYTTVASSVVLVSTQPLFSALLSGKLLGEKAPPRLYLGVLLALIGVAVIAQGDRALSARRLAGDGLALLGAVAAAGYYVIGRRLRGAVRILPYVALVYGSAALLLGAAAVAAR